MWSLNTLKHKTKLKRILYAVFILILVFCAWLAFVIFHDESPDAGRDAFYTVAEKPVPDHQNLAVAISGINAPESIDTTKHGRFVVDTYSNDLTRDAAKFLANAAGKIEFVGTTDELDCWLYEEAIKSDNCASVERIKELLIANKTLLARYKQLYQLTEWQGEAYGGSQTLINLNRLLAAEIKLNIDEGKPELAYQKWRDNFTFSNRMLVTDSTAINRAIYLVIDGFNLNSLEHLLFKSPEILTTYTDELNTLLKPTGLARYNLKGMLRAEYAYFNENLASKNKAIYFHPEFVRNQIYRMHQDFLSSTLQLPSTYEQSLKALNKTHGPLTSFLGLNWLDPFNSFLSKMTTSSFVKTLTLVKSMHNKNAQISLLNLSIKIRQQKIAKPDIQAFLNQAGSEFYNPFTNQPMQYDATKNVIYCEIPELQSKVKVRL